MPVTEIPEPAGLYRDATDGIFKVRSGITTQPTTGIIPAEGSLATFEAGAFTSGGSINSNSLQTGGAITVGTTLQVDGETTLGNNLHIGSSSFNNTQEI